jgi:hypothetical protein
VARWIRSTKQELLWFLDRYPALFPLQMRLRRSRALAVTRETEICIEGFPRSGNTFAVAAFEHAQGRRVRIARHLHSPAQVRRAVAAGLPTLLVVRRPPDPVLSLVVREPDLSVAQVLGAWVRFHEGLEDLLPSLVVAPFEIVTSDFGAVIEALNRRFGTAFAPFRHDEASELAVRRRIDAMERADSGGAEIRDHAVARPTVGREELKRQLASAWNDPALDGLRRRADAAYERFAACWTAP